MMRYEHIMAVCKGSYHHECQDAIYFKEDGFWICAVVADGLGSKQKSAYGSRLISRLIGIQLLKVTKPLDCRLATATNNWYSNIKSKGEDSDDYCTTCSFILIDKVNKKFIVGHIGDSPIFYQTDNDNVNLVKADKDFSNTTECVGYDKNVHFEIIHGSYKERIRALIATDGFGDDLDTNNLRAMFDYLVEKYSSWSSQKKAYHFKREILEFMSDLNSDDKSAIFIWNNV